VPAAAGTLNVNVDSPYACSVYVDGSLIGTTPVVGKSVAAGSHQLRIGKDSTWADYTETINVPGGGAISRNISELSSNVRRIHGHVYNMSMQPQPGASVTFQSAVVYADLLGWFDMQNPPQYSGPITARSGYLSDTLTITSPVSGGLHLVFMVH